MCGSWCIIKKRITIREKNRKEKKIDKEIGNIHYLVERDRLWNIIIDRVSMWGHKVKAWPAEDVRTVVAFEWSDGIYTAWHSWEQLFSG